MSKSRLQVNVKDLYIEGSGTPPGCDTINIAFPVVSEDSDHRLLSLQPFGLFWWPGSILFDRAVKQVGRCFSQIE